MSAWRDYLAHYTGLTGKTAQQVVKVVLQHEQIIDGKDAQVEELPRAIERLTALAEQTSPPAGVIEALIRLEQVKTGAAHQIFANILERRLSYGRTALNKAAEAAERLSTRAPGRHCQHNQS